MWQNKLLPHRQQLNRTRSKGITIIGAISEKDVTVYKKCTLLYELGTGTNLKLVKPFISRLAFSVRDPKRTVLVLDNHSAHVSLKTELLANAHGMILLFLPPTCSRLNPIEHL